MMLNEMRMQNAKCRMQNAESNNAKMLGSRICHFKRAYRLQILQRFVAADL